MNLVKKVKGFGRKLALAASLALPFVSGEVKADLIGTNKTDFVQGSYISNTWKSQYIGSRSGQVFVDAKNGVLQSAAGVNTKFGTVEYWQNLSLDDATIAEFDLSYTSPSLKLGKLELSSAFLAYKYPDFPFGKRDGWDYESDSIVKYSGALDVKLMGGVLFMQDRGSCGAVGRAVVGKTFSIGKDLSENPVIKGTKATLEGSVTYKERFFNEDQGFSHYTLSGRLEVPVTKNFTFSPGVMYNGIINSFDGKLKPAIVPCISGTWRF